MNLELAARNVAGNMKSEEYKFDVTILLLIANVITGIVPIIQDWCNKTPEETVEMAKNPTFLQRRVLAWQARKVLGRRAYRDVGTDVVDAIIKTGAETSVEDMTDLYNDV